MYFKMRPESVLPQTGSLLRSRMCTSARRCHAAFMVFLSHQGFGHSKKQQQMHAWGK
jgi:hypothetical protein